MSEQNDFEKLYSIDVSRFVEKKTTGKVSLSYLSWAFAWKEFKTHFPNATYEVVKFENGLPYCFDPNTGYMVYTKVSVGDLTHEMWLPVLDSHNDAMLAQPYEVETKYNSYTVGKCTMFDVNKTIMRCLTKNLAMFGLGLYIYAGEDLPNTETSENVKSQTSNGNQQSPTKAAPAFPETPESKQLKNSLLDWIATGVLQGSYMQKAELHMYNNDIQGMNNVIAWCQKQQKTV